MQFGSTLRPIIFGCVFLECHFNYSAGEFFVLEKNELLCPNVLRASVLIIIMRPSVFMSHVRSCVAVCVGVSTCLPVEIHTRAVL